MVKTDKPKWSKVVCMNIGSIQKAYFIGIGGIGMSALAQLLAERGIEVVGSDQSSSPVTDTLEKRGIRVHFEQVAENITDDIDLVVYTIAIPEEHPELTVAQKKGLVTKTYPEMLGVVSDNTYTIAIAGTHGKTTTTAMTADVLVDGEVAPTAIVGSLVSRYGSNFIPGEEKTFLVESCEYRRSFLNIHPDILAITNIEEDHLDYYSGIADIQDAFRDLVSRVPASGFIVCDPSDPQVKEVIKESEATIVDYTKLPLLRLSVPGEYNQKNAQVAHVIGQLMNVTNEKIVDSLQNFSGTWRRFEYKGETKNGTLIFDDYAHHPREVQVTLKAFRERFPEKELVVVFQPHLYSRTKSLLSEFAVSFAGVDRALVAPIYAAREPHDPEISHEILVQAINKETGNAEAIESFDQAISILQAADAETAIMTIGAGDVYKIGDMLLEAE